MTIMLSSSSFVFHPVDVPKQFQLPLLHQSPPDRMLTKPWRRLFLAAYTFWAKPGCCCPASQSVCRFILALRGRLLHVVYRV